MKRKLSILNILLFLSVALAAQNWDYIIASREYYYGEGQGKTIEEADAMAKSMLANSVQTTISSHLGHLIDEMKKNGEINSEEHFRAVINSTSSVTLSGLTPFQIKNEPPHCLVRYCVERSVVDTMYHNRIERAKGFISLGDDYLAGCKLDLALRYYYWAYSLILSVKDPYKVQDAEGRMLVEYLPTLIEEIVGGITVNYGTRDGNFVELLFTYKGNPVKELEIFYNDGQARCRGSVSNGLGVIEVASSHAGETYHLVVDYECSHHAKDDELKSILNIIKISLPKAAKKVQAGTDKETLKAQSKAQDAVASQKLKPSSSQLAAENERCKSVMQNVLKAIGNKDYATVESSDYFTANGLEIYNRLISYGSGRIVGVPEIIYFKGFDGGVSARGLRMSFSFNQNKKSTFVEDVVFKFNNEGKIDNISFGLGVDATNSILCKKGAKWSNEVRETITSFLENYKTAYSLKRHDYISTIFSDDAVIIMGTVLKVKSGYNPASEGRSRISQEGETIIKYNRKDKDTYLVDLKRNFARNKFINIRFPNLDVQKLTKYKDKELYGIQLQQEYYSSTYSDTGYLFLLIDFTNKDEPLITVRTWQPNEEDMEKLYNAGDFFGN